MTDPLMLILTIAILIVSVIACTVAVSCGIAARTAEKGAVKAQKAARASIRSARNHAAAAGVQAAAAIKAANAAARQATAAQTRLDRAAAHRSQDRQADAILALTRMIYREVELARDLDLWLQRAFLRSANAEEFIRAYALLPAEDHDVVQWVGRKREEVQRLVDLAHEEVAGGATTAGHNRSQAARIAAEAAEELLNWRRGQRDTASFTTDLL